MRYFYLKKRITNLFCRVVYRMSDSEVFKEEQPNIEIDVEEPAPKPAKKKRVMTDEQKARLKEQLKKGRETSMANRMKTALAKRLANKEKEEEKDAILAESLLKRSKKTAPPVQTPPKPTPAKVAEPIKEEKNSVDTSELDSFKKELAELKAKNKPKAEAPKPETPKTPAPVRRVVAMKKKKNNVFF